MSPPSHCDDCGTILQWYDNIPLFGWLLLRGRCRWCGARIPASVWLVEVVTAGLTGLACWWVFTAPVSESAIGPLGWHLAQGTEVASLAPALALMALLVVLWALIISTMTDLAHLIIPDELSKPLQLLAPFLALLLLASMGDPHASGFIVGLFQVSSEVDGQHVGQWQPWTGAAAVSLVVVGTALLLVVSLPFARWVYSSRLRTAFPWREADHQAFARGLWWFVLSLIPALLALLIFAAVSRPEGAQPDMPLWYAIFLANSLLGMLCGWLLPYSVGLLGSWAFGRNAMGYGDVKMLAWMGAFLGPLGVLYTFFLAAIYGSLVGIPMRLAGGAREIPFGPYLVLGAISVFIWGPDMSRWLFQALQL